jgi:hypothetical protein
MWMTGVVQPRLVIETCRLDDERVPVPTAFRVSHPRWLRIARERVIVVEEDLPEGRARFVEDDESARELDDLLRERYAVDTRESRRQAEALRIILAIVVPTFCKERLCPRQHHDVLGLQIDREIEVVFHVGLPDAGEVDGA